MQNASYAVGRASPATFYFVQLSTQKEIDYTHKLLNEKYTAKLMSVLGPGDKDDKEMLVLNRIIRYVPSAGRELERLEIEPDLRHAELIVRDLGLMKARGVDTPRVRGNEKEVVDGSRSKLLDSTSATLYRSCVM